MSWIRGTGQFKFCRRVFSGGWRVVRPRGRHGGTPGRGSPPGHVAGNSNCSEHEHRTSATRRARTHQSGSNPERLTAPQPRYLTATRTKHTAHTTRTTHTARREEARNRDQAEKQEFEERLRAKDEAKTKKLAEDRARSRMSKEDQRREEMQKRCACVFV